MGQKTKSEKETANVKSANIKDIFLLLPDDVFPLKDISKEAVLKWENGKDKS
ncbi:MAG: hypothetical protein GX921_01555 [Bacteroidales bacterium]|nr:hypothetical protein [Bacteroidales bacterium]